MRSLALLALVILAALPLSAHDHGRDRRPVVVEESCRPAYRWEARRYDDRRWDDRRWDDRWEARRGEDRWERHGYYRRHDWDDYRRPDCDDARVILRPLPRPLAPPFLGRVELRIH